MQFVTPLLVEISLWNLQTDKPRLVDLLELNGIFSTQVAAISCMRKFEVY